MKTVDISGQKFGRWTTVKQAETIKKYVIRYHCKCDCGNEGIVAVGQLRSGMSKSCGCLRDEKTIARSTKHGHSPDAKSSPTYYSWTGMIARCTNPYHVKFEHYGGKGITVCEEWKNFVNFLADMGEKPKGLTLDRIDSNLGYFKENCRWASWSTQQNNKCNNRIITSDGETHTLAEWSRIKGMKAAIIWDRLDTGWSIEDALNTPPKSTRLSKLL